MTTSTRRTPLADLSTNVPVAERKSTKTMGVPSVENSGQEVSVKILADQVQEGSNETFQFNLDAPTVNSNLLMEEDAVVMNETKTPPPPKSATVCSPPKRSKRVPNPRQLVNMSKNKKNITLAMHVRDYGHAHDMDY